MRVTDVPTGKIAAIEGDFGQLECLYVGDYGKNANLKAGFLGLNDDIDVVEGDLMPLEEKIVVTISTQYGCDSKCKFCDVPRVGPGRNATVADLSKQVVEMIRLAGVCQTKRLNVHYARMGEPTWNQNVIDHAFILQTEPWRECKCQCKVIHPVVSTMMPKANRNLKDFLYEWCQLKNLVYGGDAGLQLSINSTDKEQRDWLFGGSALDLVPIALMIYDLPEPKGRKYTLNFIVNDDTIIDANYLAKLFPVERFICKLTPVHKAKAAVDSGIYGDFLYTKHENALREAGFDVIVFIPHELEETGRITCGNVLLCETSCG